MFPPQVVCFRENWSEEVLHLLMETLKECYAVVFQQRSDGKLQRTTLVLFLPTNVLSTSVRR